MRCVRISASVSPIHPSFTSYIGRLAWLILHKKNLSFLTVTGSMRPGEVRHFYGKYSMYYWTHKPNVSARFCTDNFLWPIV